jgi:hypothetical protein
VSTTHNAVVVVADDGTSPVGTDEWNNAHDGIQDQDATPGVDQVIRAAHSAYIAGLPLIIASGRLVDVQAGGFLELRP